MQTVVGVLRGGPSREHDVSLKSGAAILANLPEEEYTARDIYIDRQGVWHDRGRPSMPERVLRQLDVVVVALHGKFGHDGEVQRLLERFGVPYTGADPWSAFLSSHKVMAKERAKEAGFMTPQYQLIENEEDVESAASNVIRSFHQPVIVKPVNSGSSIGVSIVGGYAPVCEAVRALFQEGESGVLIEEVIRGKEATAGVVEGLRGETLYSLPPVEIIPPEGHFFNYTNKYDGSTREIVPGNFSRVTSEELQRAAKVMHRVLGLRHYSRSDFIVSPKGIYFLETNNSAAVGLTGESLLPKSLAAVGVSFRDFLSHLVKLALGR
ncbi:MAG: ATP-grasp domain-containing protein [Patescibacteria group bacterium]|nr:ATP-grasp domain-containing protein [Patescibacteria group bacterium]